MSRWAFQFFSPIILFCLMLIDGQLSNFFTYLFAYHIFPTSHLMLIFLMYTVKKHQLPYLLIMSVALGIIYDSYFIGVIGISAALLPLIALFVNEIQKTVFQNPWTKIFTTIIIVFAFELILAVVGIAFKFFEVSLVTVIVRQLAPSLILNIIYIAALQFPLDILYRDEKRKSHIGKAT